MANHEKACQHHFAHAQWEIWLVCDAVAVCFYVFYGSDCLFYFLLVYVRSLLEI